MANENNLKPVRSKEEARERGRIGGKASGKARSEKKALKDRLLLLLDAMSETEPSISNRDSICAKLIGKALSGDVKAFEVIRDTIGEKPKDEIDVEVKNNEAQSELREYLCELKKR